MTSGDEDLALAQFVAAVAYGQLAGFALTASLVPLAPDIAAAEHIGSLSRREYDEYAVLRAHLDSLTDLPDGLLARQRPIFDEFLAGAADHGWDHACAALAFGWSIAHDFLTRMSESLPSDTRQVLSTVTAHHDVESFALAQLRDRITTPADRDEMREVVAGMLGRALAGYQKAMQDTDALDVLLDDESRVGGVASRELAIDILAQHRRRLAALGIDDPD